MPRNKQGTARRKKRVHMIKESPFPIPISSLSGEPAGAWFYFTGYIEGSAVVIKHSGDMDFLYKMGFFGKGTLSRSQPNFHERSHRVRLELPQKNGHHKDTQAVVVNKRSYLVHQRYKALADGTTKDYSDIVYHEEQQQGFVDSSDEEKDENSSDESSSGADVDVVKMEAFRLLNTQNDNIPSDKLENSATSENSNLKGPMYISGIIRSHLVSILTEVSALSSEQITTFMRVPQDVKFLAEKFKTIRAAEINIMRQMYASQFPGRNFKEGEVITLDEDDSTAGTKNFENETDNAVVISDSDEEDRDDMDVSVSKKVQSIEQGTEFLSRRKGGTRNGRRCDVGGFVADAPKKDIADWASDDDSSFWDKDKGACVRDKGVAELGTLECPKVEDKVSRVVDVECVKVDDKVSRVVDVECTKIEDSISRAVDVECMKKNISKAVDVTCTKIEDTVSKAVDAEPTKVEDVIPGAVDVDRMKIKDKESKAVDVKCTEVEDTVSIDAVKNEDGTVNSSQQQEQLLTDDEGLATRILKEEVDEKKEAGVTNILKSVPLADSEDCVNHQDIEAVKVETDIGGEKGINISLSTSTDNKAVCILSSNDKPVVKEVGNHSSNGSAYNSAQNISAVDANSMNTSMEVDTDDSGQMLTISSDGGTKCSLEVECSKKNEDFTEDSKVSKSDIMHTNLSDRSAEIETSQHPDGKTLDTACKESADNSAAIGQTNVPNHSTEIKTNQLGCTTLNDFCKDSKATDISENNAVKQDEGDSVKQDEDNAVKQDEETQVIPVDSGTSLLSSNTIHTLAKDEKASDASVYDSESHKLSEKAYSSSLLVSKQKVNMLSITNSDSCTENDTVLSNPDNSVTNIESDNSNDSDDVICIESKSAEPKKLHNFLSQTAKKPVFPVVTKSVTFMSSNSEEPTFVCASVGFHEWGPILNFNFTGDPSHLPTVMSVSSHPVSATESSSHNGQLQDPEVVYERIYPTIRSLVPTENSTGAVIKQRHKGLPCLTAAYLKVSQTRETSRATTSTGNTRITQNPKELPASRPSQPRFKPYSRVLTPGVSSTQNSIQSFPSDILTSSISSRGSSDTHKITSFHVSSYIKAYQSVDLSTPSGLGDAVILHKDRDESENSCGTSPLSVIVNKLEKLYNTEFSDYKHVVEDQVVHKTETDNIVTEFNVALTSYISSVDISHTVESDLVNLLLSKCKNNSDISDETLTETRSKLSTFQIWLLEMRLKYLQKNYQDGLKAVVVVDLTTNSEMKVGIPHSRSNLESEINVDVDLVEHSGKIFDVAKVQITNSDHIDDNLLEECTKREGSMEETLKHSHTNLEKENRKRKFDRSDDVLEDNEKKSKLNEDASLTLSEEGDEKRLSNCKPESQALPSDVEDMMLGEDLPSEQIDETTNQGITVKESTSNDVGLNALSEESCLMDTSNDVKLNAGNELTTSTSLQPESEDGSDDKRLLKKEDTECSPDTNTGLSMDSKEPTKQQETRDVKTIDSSTVTHPFKPSQKLENSNSLIKISPSSAIDTGNEYIMDDERKEEVCSETCEDKSLDIISPKIEELNSSEAPKTASLERMPCGNVAEQTALTSKQNLEGSVSNLIMKSESDKIDVKPSCLGSLGSDRGIVSHGDVVPISSDQSKNRDLGPKMDTDSSKLNTVLNCNQKDETMGEDSIQNPGSSENFQICIGSSSDDGEDDDLPKPRNLHPPSSEGVHPYSIEDEADGNLFVVANTSDEDYEEDCYDENGKRVNRKRQQLWRPCVKKDPYPTEEKLHLMLEEAFFLSFGLGCLRILDPEMKLLDLTQMWQQFQVLKDLFVPHYVAYHYFRSKGWVPKSGLKFGCDLILYKDGPPFYHGSYSVIVVAVKDTTLLPINRNGGISFDHRKLSWTSLAGLNRITEHVAKELMVCYVIWPGDLTHEQSLSPACISRFKVKEVIVSRWVSSQERENRLEEEEIP